MHTRFNTTVLGLMALLVLAPGLAAQERVEARHDLAANARLTVGAIHHEVTVRVWDRNEIEVVATIDTDVERLEVSGSSDDLSIRIEQDRNRQVRGGGSMELRIPRGVRLTIGTVSGGQVVEGLAGTARLSSVSGGIWFDGAAESAEFNSVSGSVRVTGPMDRTTVSTVSGGADLDGLRGRVEVNTVSGRIGLEAGGPLDHLRARSVSGTIQVVGPVAPDASVKMESHSGSLTLRLDPSTPAEYEMDTMSGRIRNGITDDEAGSSRFGPGRSLAFRVGEASATIRMSSFSGTLTVESR